jgi:hypothetical protein
MEAQVREVLRRVLVDDDFLHEMLSNPEQALRDYDLTDEERSILVNPERDLQELMRIGGDNFPTIAALIIIFIELDLTEFITSFHVTVVIDGEFERRQTLARDKITSLATSVLAMKAGADRLERIHEMLQVVSGATELAAHRSRGHQTEQSG